MWRGTGTPSPRASGTAPGGGTGGLWARADIGRMLGGYWAGFAESGTSTSSDGSSREGALVSADRGNILSVVCCSRSHAPPAGAEFGAKRSLRLVVRQ